MQIDIAESIRETLAELKPVGLYGIGTMSLIHNSASFGEQRKSLQPPSMSLHFSESSSSNTPLFQWLQEKYNISKTDAEIAFKIFCEKLLNGLVNYGKVNITGIASFKQNDQMVLSCTPDKDFVNLFYKGLPEIPVSHIDRREIVVPFVATVAEHNEDSSELDSVNKLNTFDESESTIVSEDSIDSLVESATPESNEIDHPIETDYEESFEISRNDFVKEDIDVKVVPIAQDNTKNISKTVNENITSFDSKTTWDPKPLSTSYEDDSFFNGRNIALLLGLLMLIVLGYFGCQKYFGSSDGGTSISEDTSGSKSTILTYADSLSNGLIEKERYSFNGVPLPEKCIIVTGVFKKSRNAIRMQDRLLRGGYDVFQSAEGGSTRVGFKFDCREVNLEEYLQNIRRTISKKAWYLDPSLYVEYE